MKLKRLLAVLLVLIHSPVWGAVGYDTSATATGNGLTSLTITSYTVTGSNTLLLCSAALSASTPTVDGVIFNASPLTLVSSHTASNRGLSLWRLTGVSGTQDVTFTFNDVSPSNIIVGCATLTGVNQGVPLGSPSTGSDYVSSPVNITVPSDGMSYDVAADYNQTPNPVAAQTAGGSQTKRFDDNFDDGGSGNNTTMFSSTRTTSGTHTWTSPGGEFELQIGVPINAVGGASPRIRMTVVQ